MHNHLCPLRQAVFGEVGEDRGAAGAGDGRREDLTTVNPQVVPAVDFIILISCHFVEHNVEISGGQRPSG